MFMGVKRKFTGVAELGYSNKSLSIDNFSSNDVRIQIKEKLTDSEKTSVIWIDLKTAIQMSKELRNVISQAKTYN